MDPEANDRPSLVSQFESLTLVSQKVAIEEYRQVVEERRFVMTRYMQALGLYLALAGYGLKSLIETPSFITVCILATLFTALNAVAIFAAGQFKSMALHALAREAVLATKLGVGKPHPLTWGYLGGIIVVFLSQATLIGVVLLRMRFGVCSQTGV